MGQLAVPSLDERLAAIYDSDLKSGPKSLAAFLAFRMRAEAPSESQRKGIPPEWCEPGTTWVSISTIRRCTSLARNSVIAYLKTLVAAQWFERIPTANGLMIGTRLGPRFTSAKFGTGAKFDTGAKFETGARFESATSPKNDTGTSAKSGTGPVSNLSTYPSSLSLSQNQGRERPIPPHSVIDPGPTDWSAILVHVRAHTPEGRTQRESELLAEAQRTFDDLPKSDRNVRLERELTRLRSECPWASSPEDLASLDNMALSSAINVYAVELANRPGPYSLPTISTLGRRALETLWSDLDGLAKDLARNHGKTNMLRTQFLKERSRLAHAEDKAASARTTPITKVRKAAT